MSSFLLQRILSLSLGALLMACPAPPGRAAEVEAGPLFHQFKLTLHPGERTEAFGPLYYRERKDTTRLWAAPPLLSYTQDEDIDYSEFDLLYPLLSYDRFGPEYRFHILQVFSFAGGQDQSETNTHRFTLFPIYFQQRSADPDRNYTALVPLYGHLRNRFFRDEVNFVLMPLYVQTRKRDVLTYNVPYPFFHWRRGDGLQGWQLWPLFGTEHKDLTTKTNAWGDEEVIGGHDKRFALWPVYLDSTLGLGTTNLVRQRGLLPLYTATRSPQRDSFTCPWPLGYTYTDDRQKKYREWGAPWPVIAFARGEGKTMNRVWPLFSQARNESLESNFYLWPVYKVNRIHGDTLERERVRILFFLYSDLTEKNTETGTALRRTDLWPLFTARRDHDGNERLQMLALLEPFVPNNKSIERDYSPLWSIWRSEKNARTGAASQSFLWNLYRHDTTPEMKKCSLLFGLFQYQFGSAGRRARVFFVPIGKKITPAAQPAAP
jgi:hypothetical protein